MRSLRQEGGLSGFTKRSDPNLTLWCRPFLYLYFAGYGMAVARDLQGRDNHDCRDW